LRHERRTDLLEDRMTVDRSRSCRVPTLAAPSPSHPSGAVRHDHRPRRDGARAAPKQGGPGAMPVRLAGLGLALAALALSVPVAAQTPAPAPAPAAAPAPGEAWSTERSRRDADKVLQWIKLHADLPRKGAKDDRGGGAKRATEADAGRTAKPAAPTAPVTAGAVPAANATAGPAAAPPPLAAATPAARAADAMSTGARTDAVAPARVEPAAAPAVAIPAPVETAIPAPPARVAVAASVEEEPEALVPIDQTPPSFQRRLMEQLRKGNVEVRLTVAPDGQVSDVQVLASTHPRLQAPVVAAVRQWRFKPLRAPQSASVELGFDIDREL
jgi:TonB family protein